MQEYLPREKFIQSGCDSMTDLDLLCTLVETGAKGIGFREVARRVLKEIRGKVEKGGQLGIEGMVQLKGVGEAKAVKILAGIELGRRLYCKVNSRSVVSTSQTAYELVKQISKRKQEHLVAIFLNARYELLGKKTVGIGTVNKLEIVPRDIIIPALNLNSAAVILAHNHPSGDSSPSSEDIDMTARIKKAFDIVGILLLDHIVVGSDSYKSIQVV